MSTLKKSLVIYGCGGHARSLADVALSNGIEQLIFVDNDARDNEKQFGFDVVKNFSLEKTTECILALGDNKQRAALFDSLKNNIISLISIHAHIGKNAEIAKGVFVGNGAHIGPNAKIGENTIINTHAVVEHDCVIGKHSHISVNAVVAGKSTVGDFVMIGTGATVIDRIKMCSHVTVGAGAVVVRDITEPGTYVGVPARKTEK
ncbi:MAG TPA: NeuD/PglB/VioB family sugar acetyltransferase [Gammaproteobacteria bacterium]|nr:NeuD/PglB/VioB family sugar acetyltransferase [Gammaproteobacteria bacterium]